MTFAWDSLLGAYHGLFSNVRKLLKRIGLPKVDCKEQVTGNKRLSHPWHTEQIQLVATIPALKASTP